MVFSGDLWFIVWLVVVLFGFEWLFAMLLAVWVVLVMTVCVWAGRWHVLIRVGSFALCGVV